MSRNRVKRFKPRNDFNSVVQAWKPAKDLWKSMALRAYEEINTPFSLKLYMLLESGADSREIASSRPDPCAYTDRLDFQKDWMAAELLRKFDGLPGISADERKQAALTKAAAAEALCSRTNSNVLNWELGSGYPAGVESVISRARQKIIRVLGEYDLEEHLDLCRWGPGSDALNKRPYVSNYHKFKSLLSATKGVMPLVQLLMERNNLWSTWLCGHEVSGPFSPLVSFFKGNGALTVPKTALTDRFICVEPAANIYLQLGIGAMIRRRLRRVGIDLDSQELNRFEALKSSEDDMAATIDLSSASDTIARRFIQHLFSGHPKLEIWLRVLDMTRSPFTTYGTRKSPEVRLNHKFSSMGNGYTFELESLVFWAIGSSAAEVEGGECLAVYGDDIIVTSNCFARVTEALVHCGFEINFSKSYVRGYFRESCGMNAWNGYELPTYRLTTLVDLASVYSLHNGLRRCGLTKTATYVLHRIPKDLRFFGPQGVGDGCLHNPDYTSWKIEPHGLVDQWFFWAGKLKCLVFSPQKEAMKAFEPAIIHSISTLVPLKDHPIYVGGRWGSEGFATLSIGKWTVSEVLVSRENLGMPEAWPPGGGYCTSP